MGCFIGLFGQINVANGETVGERFEKAMKKTADYCATHKIDPANHRCDITKLQPADPLATEEGRFAHSIKIPNPVPEDSGYKPVMTSEQYFEHLCKTEAGEFIYKTVENVGSVIQLRPRLKGNFEYSHLYAFEDPFGFEAGEAFFVEPGRYTYYEVAAPVSMSHKSKYTRFFGYDGRRMDTLQQVGYSQRKSRYGYTWRGIVRPHDRELGIGGGELIVLDLETSEVIGVYRGYAKFEINEKIGLSDAGWRNRCPQINSTGGPYGQLLLKVLMPGTANSSKEGEENATK